MSRIGIAISGGPNPAEIIDLVVLAESLGYESAWVAEGSWRRPVRDSGGLRDADLAHTARHQHQQRVCSHRTDDRHGRLHDRRSVRRPLHSGARVQSQGAGRTRAWVVYTKPLTRTRETVAIVRELIREGRVSFQGETIRIENFDLWYTPRHRDIPLYLSAVFQKGIVLCGEVADGIILTRSTLRTAAQVRMHLAEGARNAGRDRGPDRGHLLIAGLGRRYARCGARRVCARASRSIAGFSHATTG